MGGAGPWEDGMVGTDALGASEIGGDTTGAGEGAYELAVRKVGYSSDTDGRVAGIDAAAAEAAAAAATGGGGLNPCGGGVGR